MRAALLSLILTTPAVAQTVAPVRVVSDTLFGVVIDDPYRWMEDESDPEVTAWVTEQETAARAALDEIPGRSNLRDRIAELLRTGSGVLGTAETPLDLLMVRETADGFMLTARASEGSGWSDDERVVFDAAAFAPDEPPDFRASVPSPDGRFVAIGRSRRGDSEPEIIIVETATGRVLPERLEGVLLTSGGSIRPTWHPDGSGLFYPRTTPADESAEALFRGRFVFHRLGTDPAVDTPVFGFGLSSVVPMKPADTPNRMIAGVGSGWLIGSVWDAAALGTVLYAVRADQLSGAETPWRLIAGGDEGIDIPVLVGDTAYAILTAEAPRGRLARLDLTDPAARWETVLPEQAGVLVQLRAASDALYATERVGGAMRMLRLRYDGGGPETVSLPIEGTLSLTTRAEAPGVRVTAESWLVPPRLIAYDPDNGTATDTGLLSADTTIGAVIAERFEAVSDDCTRIPVSIVRLRDQPLDGTAPLILEAYGTFGVSVDPTFSPQWLAWVERGGVYAFAHIRGGGELGEAWHDAASGARKPVSSADLVAAAKALTSAGYAAVGRIGLYGISAGGLLGANAVIDRPDLFGAAIHDVSPFDLIGMSRSPTGARNLAEYGWDGTAEGVRAALGVSPYHRLRTRTAYPAVLIHSGAEDYNADLWMWAKYVARLQAATTSGKPVLWNVSREGGHDSLLYGGPDAFADALAFFLWQLGDPSFQPE